MGQILVRPTDKELSVKTDEQRRIITEYFFSLGGCLSNTISDDEYFNLVMEKQKSLNLKKRALAKLNINEADAQEIPPVELGGFSDEGSYMAKNYLTSKFETTWIFFGNEQLYIYSFTFDMTSDSKKERTEEYFYKDVTNFSSETESDEIIVNEAGCFGAVSSSKAIVDRDKFSIIVPGGKFTYSMKISEEMEERIQGMKQKLREKKNA